MNAFHPDYMKTFYPDFMREFRTIQANQTERAELKKKRSHTKKPKVSVKIPKQSINSRVNQRMTMAEVTEELLKVTTFRVYSKAGVK
jgi:hypothetical protein